ncbi:DUF4159 domain-containing protein [Acuticoccus sp. I52.16.1]|uniref:DUF4159 domain-containing protein n=1 Tax=Acuticoccus sp. I52.16.1 TaxID=2928472 RepID=UPI001FD3232A|nr:DUF4159 domain-containing protein [Acuticoccus sp. I52.16.1]UOM35540.1 DUF4159 domain-containing protein [Acuticoccus sp. I52.16.1]
MTALGFGAPLVLWALLLLPVLWWLMRSTPPRPRDITFAPTRLLMSLAKREETPSRTPWWLMALRLALAACVIIALAQPILRPDAAPAAGDGPALILVDNTFGAAADWSHRTDTAARLIDEAEAADRAVILAGTADAAAPLTGRSPGEARDLLRSLEPQPWHAARAALATRLAEVRAGSAAWLADGLGSEDDGAFWDALDGATDGPVRLFLPEAGEIIGIADVSPSAEGMSVTLTADADPGQLPRTVRAVDPKGFVLAEGSATFRTGSTAAVAELELPTELRNDALRVTVAGERTAAAVRLLDERFRRRTVGLISGGSLEQEQPLLSPLHYLRAALGPSADLREPSAQDLPTAITELIDAGTSVIVLADVGTLLPATQDALARWINSGGVLLRFAGPRTSDGTDDLFPVPLRSGARTLGGTLSWSDPQPLSDFSQNGPFASLAVPGDVTVTRQLLAEPSIALTERTWATLADGTPFVTGRNVGAGWVVFFHVTADTGWSTLPLSGSFVEMLRAVVELSTAGSESAGEDGPSLPPYRVLDGTGRLIAPGPNVQPVSGEVTLGPRTPPGLYGADGAFRAVNLLEDGEILASLNRDAFVGATISSYTTEGPTELKGPLMTLAAALFVLDALAILLLMGSLRRRTVASVAALALGLAVAAAPQAEAQTGPAADAATTRPAGNPVDLDFAMRASLQTRLAYVSTGNADVDRVSEAGLTGLSQALTSRTAVEPAEPMAVNIESDELAFFPLIYWPITPEADRPSDAAIARVDAYMKNGGTILFDTRDQSGAVTLSGASPATMALRRILDGLDIPPLEPVPEDHVLTKTFYLLDGFPGRWTGSPLWVETSLTSPSQDRPARAGDGVSPILITANDLAGAWAVNDQGSFLLPTSPADPYQRELAYRAGINIAIYTMTGNYKADQVHIPALLERLGQ